MFGWFFDAKNKLTISKSVKHLLIKMTFNTRKKIIVINSHQTYGGNIVLDLLSKLLRENGINAKTFYVHKFPCADTNLKFFWKEWIIYTIKYHIKKFAYKFLKETKYRNHKRFNCFKYIPIKGVKEKYTPFFDKDNTILIYPEVVFGNFLHAKNVVRWLLYHYVWNGNYSAYDSNDFFICYREIFNDWKLNPEGHILNLKFYDSLMYQQYNFLERNGNCYIIRKGSNRKDLPKKFDGPIIDDLSEEEKVYTFNNCRYCYCYDMQTFYVKIAAICGCIPIVVLEEGKTKEDYRGENELSTPGIAFGNTIQEIQYAIDTREKLLEELNFTETNQEEVEKFIKILTNRFYI